MGFFTGLKSKESSESSTIGASTASQNDNGGLSLNLSNLNLSSNGRYGTAENELNFNLTTTTTDFGSIESALNLASENVDNVLMYGAGLTNAALDLTAGTTENALTFGAGALNLVIDSNMKSQENAFTFSAGALQEVGDATENALTFGAGAFEAATESFIASQESFIASNESKDDIITQALSFVGQGFTAFMDQVSGVLDSSEAAVQSNQSQIFAFTDKALGVITDNAESESQKTNDQILKFGAGVGVLLVLLMGIMAWSKNK